MRLLRSGLVFVLAFGVVAPAAAQDLLSHYTFDAGPNSGSSYTVGETIDDVSGQNGEHDLTVVDAELEWTAEGQVGGAVQLNGSDGFLEDADAENYLNDLDTLTVVVWVKSNTTGTNNGILTSEAPDGDDQNLSLRYDADGDFGGGTNVIKGGIDTDGGKQEYESASNVQTTDWQFLALIYEDGKPLRLYVDGDFSNPTYNPETASGKISGVQTLRVGQGAKQTDDIWNGRIDDLRIYGSVLSESDLDDIYDTTLPVELSTFRVQADGRDAVLTWTTSSETNNAGFHVEHRGPGAQNWSRSRFVDGNGTTSQPQSYRVRQSELTPGTHQFRLVQVDLDGTTRVHATKPVTIRPADAFTMRVGPNPSRTQAQVTLHGSIEASVTVSLYNVLGERVRVLHDGPLSTTHRLRVPTATLASGTYFVRAVSAHLTRTQTFTVAR